MYPEMDLDADVYKRPLTAIRYEVIRACARLSCDFRVTGVDTFQDMLPEKHGTAFLVGPELVATSAHLLDIIPDRSEYYTIKKRQKAPAADKIQLELLKPTNLRDSSKSSDTITREVMCVPEEEFDEKSVIYTILTTSKPNPIYVSSGYLSLLLRNTTRTITLTFPQLNNREIKLSISYENFHDDITSQWSPSSEINDIQNESHASANSNSTTDADEVLTLCPEAHCAYDHDCAVIQLDEKQAVWDTIPLQLGGGIHPREAIYLFGFPRVTRGSILSLEGKTGADTCSDYRCPPTSHRIPCEFAAAGEDSDPRGFSGGPIIAEDGTCLGIQCSLIPADPETGASGTQLRTIYAAPILYLQRLLPFRLEIKHRPRVYLRTLRAIEVRRKSSFIDPIVIIHKEHQHIGKHLNSVIKSYQEIGSSRMRTDILDEFNDALLELWRSSTQERIEKTRSKIETLIARASLIVICISQNNNQKQNGEIVYLIEQARRYAHENAAISVCCSLTKRNQISSTVEEFAIDVSETLPILLISEFGNKEHIMALTSMMHRIDLLFQQDDQY